MTGDREDSEVKPVDPPPTRAREWRCDGCTYRRREITAWRNPNAPTLVDTSDWKLPRSGLVQSFLSSPSADDWPGRGGW
jgi:hypothetical protein